MGKEHYDEMINNLRTVYPHEGCGVLLGGGDRVTKVCSVENIRKERANDRYEIDPRDILRIEKEASREGLDIIGFFHSHPDHPDRPSEFDRERAWPDYRYVIVSVHGGSEVSARSWVLSGVKGEFQEDGLTIEG
ncbi:MAG: M67 family metallopeptidase [Thermodesulfobacteriota bacterium]